jgi:tetratricopeptide (TPR) repeat protein
LNDVNLSIKLNSKSASAYLVRVEINKHLGNWDQAIEDLKIADGLQPKTEMQSHRSNLEAAKKAWLKQQADIRAVLARYPDNPTLLGLEGQSLIALGQPVEALSRYKHALQLLSSSQLHDARWRRDVKNMKQRIQELEEDPRCTANSK